MKKEDETIDLDVLLNMKVIGIPPSFSWLQFLSIVIHKLCRYRARYIHL
jgi:hypothetical protein